MLSECIILVCVFHQESGLSCVHSVLRINLEFGLGSSVEWWCQGYWLGNALGQRVFTVAEVQMYVCAQQQANHN